MQRSVKANQSNKPTKDAGQGPKLKREGNLLRENLNRRKLQARARARLEGGQARIDVVDD